MDILHSIQYGLASLIVAIPAEWFFATILLYIGWRFYKKKYRKYKYPYSQPKTDAFDSFDYLRKGLSAVNDQRVIIKPRSILGYGETKIYYAAKNLLQEEPFTSLHVFAQASLGELFKTLPEGYDISKDAFLAYNSRRSDLVITNKFGIPILMIEYQGEAHHEGDEYFLRDEIKRRVFQKAGVKLLEIFPDINAQNIKAKIKEQLESALGVAKEA